MERMDYVLYGTASSKGACVVEKKTISSLFGLDNVKRLRTFIASLALSKLEKSWSDEIPTPSSGVYGDCCRILGPPVPPAVCWTD